MSPAKRPRIIWHNRVGRSTWSFGLDTPGFLGSLGVGVDGLSTTGGGETGLACGGATGVACGGTTGVAGGGESALGFGGAPFAVGGCGGA